MQSIHQAMRGRLLITGATGFLGRAVVRRAVKDGYPVRVAVRNAGYSCRNDVSVAMVPELGPDTDWRVALQDVTVVVHCAARAHIMHEASSDPLEEFRRVNVTGTLQLARQAAQAGVKRFVLISSIGVNGAESFAQPFSADDAVSPHSPYALSKWEAEQGLTKLAATTGLEVVIIRSPLIYGPGAPGNFAQLLRAVRRHIPLPFGRLRNSRSFVALDNIVDLIVTCIAHPRAMNQVFLVSDGEDLSTTEFIRRIGAALGRPPCLIPVPERWLHGLARVLGKEQQLRKLTGSLQVDIAKTISMLSWQPVIGMNEALSDAVREDIDR